MAEGFIQKSDDEGNSQRTLEDVGSEYFNYLLSNSLFQDVEKDELGCITSCKMHDLVHDLAQLISHPKKVVDIGVKLWHSLFLQKFNLQIDQDFKGLRVLKFCDGRMISFLPESIGSLKHLRYFDISNTGIRKLPKSITQLYLLQTLRLLSHGFLEKLPKEMTNLVSLRHLYVGLGSLVPDEVGCLTNLRTLPVFNVGREKGRGIGELGSLSELEGELVISDLQNVRNKEDAQGAKIREKRKLERLRYEWRMREVYEEAVLVLEGLEPHSNLKCLTIDGYKGECCPSWLVRLIGVSGSFQPINLVKLKLFGCTKLKELPTNLGLCPKLKFLHLEGLDNVKSIGKGFYMNDDDSDSNGDHKNKCMTALFPALEIFTLKEMKELREWVDVEPTIHVFPSLKMLKIRGCSNLSGVPVMSRFSSLETLSIIGCKELSLIGDEPFPFTLKKLEIEGCKKLRSIQSVQAEGGISFLKELHVTNCEELSKMEERLLASMCLRYVLIQGCPKLTSLEGCSSLSSLFLQRCEGLTSLPSGLRTCSSLEVLCIQDCPNLKLIPEYVVGQLHSLRRLEITRCQNLKWFPEESVGIGCLTRLKELKLGPFSEELDEFPFLTSIPSSLEELHLVGWKKLSSLPHQLQHLTGLKELQLWNFNGVKALPEWLGNLFSLQKLVVWNCENLERLPSKEAMHCLSNLKDLSIYFCPRLEENRAEQSKISHIPRTYDLVLPL